MTNLKSYTIVESKRIYYELYKTELIKDNSTILIFLHEGLGCVELWKKFPKLISDKLNLPFILYDRYGYGKSEKLSELRTIEYLETEAKIYLPQLIKNLGLDNKKIILLGHSDGASIALIYNGINEFKNIIATVSIAAHVVIEQISREGIQKAVEAFENGGLENALSKYHGDNTKTAFYGWAHTWLDKSSEKWDITHYLHNISNPVLIIQGENDEYGSELQVEKIFNSVSGTKEKIIIKSSAHSPHFDNTQLVVDKIYNFINSHT